MAPRPLFEDTFPAPNGAPNPTPPMPAPNPPLHLLEKISQPAMILAERGTPALDRRWSDQFVREKAIERDLFFHFGIARPLAQPYNSNQPVGSS